MKILIFLLVLMISLDAEHQASGSNRRSRMSNFWRTQLSRRRNSESVGDERSPRQSESQTQSPSSSSSSSPTPQSPSSSSSEAPAVSRPTGKDCKLPGFFPTPGSCIYFHRCVDWYGDGSFFSAFSFTCPVGTVFDDHLDICNYPHAAKRPECSDSAQAQPLPTNTSSSPSEEENTSSSTSTSTTTTTATSTQTESVTASPGTLPCDPDGKYKKHPEYCNQYYYCINETEKNIPIFTCPLGLVFDETNQICTREERNLVENCTLAPYSTPRPVPSEGPSSEAGETTPTVTATPIDITTQKTFEVDPDSLYDCPAPGYYPFEGDCVRFYKCVETDLSQLKGLLYRCPEGFGYADDRQRCLKESTLPPCDRVPQDAHIRVETATQLYPEDLSWFFKTK